MQLYTPLKMQFIDVSENLCAIQFEFQEDWPSDPFECLYSRNLKSIYVARYT